MTEIGTLAPGVIQDAYYEAFNFSLPNKSLSRPLIGNAVAIDMPEAVEIDDALGCRIQDDGRTLQVCIADVGSHLYDKPAIRTVAEQRRKTVYKSHRPVEPMLPSVISKTILSLQNNTKRPVVTVHIPVDSPHWADQAEVTLNTAHITRVTYNTADEAIATQRSVLLGHLQSITGKLLQMRMAERSLESHTTQTEEEKVATSSAQLLVSEAMIAANAALAQYAIRHNIPSIFRSLSLPQSYTSNSEPTVRQYFGNPTPRVGHSHQPSKHPLLGHYAYLHGTSPLRRLEDFVNQCNVTAFLEGREYPYPQDKVAQIATYLNECDYAFSEPVPQALTELIAAGDITTAQLATILFSPDQTARAVYVKKKALGYLLKNPHRACPVIDTGVNTGKLAANVRGGAEGNPLLVLRSPDGTQTSFRAYNARNPAQASHMVKVVSQMAGLQIPAEFLHNDYSTERRILRNPQRYMSYLQRRHDLGYQTTAEQQDDGAYAATAYTYFGGELQAWTAEGQIESEARSSATRQLIVDMDYIRRPPPFVQSFESFMRLEATFHPENCLRRVVGYHGLPQPMISPASQRQAGYFYYTAAIESPECNRSLTATDNDPYSARQRAAYRMLKGVLYDLRKMGRL